MTLLEADIPPTSEETLVAADPAPEVAADVAREEHAHPGVEMEPAAVPPPPSFPRGWFPSAALLGSVVCAGSMLTLTSQRNPLLDVAANPQPAEISPAEEPGDLLAGEPRAYEPAGPPRPAPALGIPTTLASAAGALQPVPGTSATGPGTSTGPRGRIGYMGPITGPLNTNLSGVGPVRGPIWTGAPLPNVLGIGPLAHGAPQPPQSGAGPRLAGPASGGDVGSELPDADKLALARLANPALSGVKPAVAVQSPGGVTPEKPLYVHLSVARPARGYEPGATVAVRGSARTDAYFVLIGVDGQGNASTLFRSSSPARSFGFAVRAQSTPGPQYLVAIASVEPPTGGDVAAAMRASGQGFAAPAVALASGGAQPGAAWAAAVSQAAGLGGGAKGWKRHEWSVSTTSFFTRAPTKVAVERRKPEQPVAPKVGTPDGSILPTGTKPETPSSEKSAMPVVKPESAQPKSPMALPEPAKPAVPAAKPEAPAPKPDAPTGKPDESSEANPGG